MQCLRKRRKTDTLKALSRPFAGDARVIRVRQSFDFEEPAPIDKGIAEPAFLVDLDGFEGPLDLLLELARRQKVDLHKISILALAEQYLGFVEMARVVRLELAADYLVMAAWLAYLKSRLLLPAPPREDEPAAADLAAALAARLRKLEAIRRAAALMMERPRLGRDMFVRGAPEQIVESGGPQWQAGMYDLLSAYASQRQKNALSHVTLHRRIVWSIAEARNALEAIAGVALDWSILEEFLARFFVTPQTRRTVRASSFSASLEMVREGHIELRQDKAFAPLWIRGKRPAGLASVQLSGG